ncbi:MAG: DUF4935 domain-containing protein [Burkholderiales bacterium]|nr:DUF4935 domain-containing protein [Burkholderiales bacterium]MDR4517425.1 PIN domain-containing protein [Nitrosomonas sp.]
MIHVVLDTNIYRNNPNRDNLHFKALGRLSKEGAIKVHIPYVVLREFQTQQREIYSKDLAKAVSGLGGLSRKQLDKTTLDTLNNIKSELKNKSEGILCSAENQITNWANSIGASIYPLCIDQTNAALEAYFQGSAPLKSIKNRDDIPDSFIVQSIYKLSSETKEIHVVAGDEKVRDAFSSENLIHTYESLSEFIESDYIQNELKDLDLIKNIDSIVRAIEQFENNNSEIMNFISNKLGDAIVGKAFSDPSIPDDNNEATVNSYDEAEDVEFDFNEVGYYGNGQFGIPFSAKIVVLADYYIFKSDYYCMDPEREHVPSVTDHNKHYFEAEDEFELSVSGLVSIAIDRDNINFDDFSESIIKESFEIDEITNIELC